LVMLKIVWYSVLIWCADRLICPHSWYVLFYLFTLDFCHLLIHTVGRATRAGRSSLVEKEAKIQEHRLRDVCRRKYCSSSSTSGRRRVRGPERARWGCSTGNACSRLIPTTTLYQSLSPDGIQLISTVGSFHISLFFNSGIGWYGPP
jgi:hypothetical protein